MAKKTNDNFSHGKLPYIEAESVPLINAYDEEGAKGSVYDYAFKNKDIDKMSTLNLGVNSMFTGNVPFDIGLSIGRRIKKKKQGK